MLFRSIVYACCMVTFYDELYEATANMLQYSVDYVGVLCWAGTDIKCMQVAKCRQKRRQ